jgi:hypothetical protein
VLGVAKHMHDQHPPAQQQQNPIFGDPLHSANPW